MNDHEDSIRILFPGDMERQKFIESVTESKWNHECDGHSHHDHDHHHHHHSTKHTSDEGFEETKIDAWDQEEREVHAVIYD